MDENLEKLRACLIERKRLVADRLSYSLSVSDAVDPWVYLSRSRAHKAIVQRVSCLDDEIKILENVLSASISQQSAACDELKVKIGKLDCDIIIDKASDPAEDEDSKLKRKAGDQAEDEDSKLKRKASDQAEDEGAVDKVEDKRSEDEGAADKVEDKRSEDSIC